jgi:hypothetical protein
VPPAARPAAFAAPAAAVRPQPQHPSLLMAALSSANFVRGSQIDSIQLRCGGW